MAETGSTNFNQQVLAELDRRHDELLAQLDELDRRIEQVLKGVQQERPSGPSCGADDAPPG